MTSYAISMVILVFDRQQLGERAVLSACSQTLEGLEVIVVDDGSQPPFQLPKIDDQVAVRLIRLPVNSGVSTARNAGIRAARGEWIALLDSGDYWLPLTLEPRFTAARQYRESSQRSLIAHAAGFIIKRQTRGRSADHVRRSDYLQMPVIVCGRPNGQSPHGYRDREVKRSSTKQAQRAPAAFARPACPRPPVALGCAQPGYV